jgi:hypothetical protein
MLKLHLVKLNSGAGGLDGQLIFLFRANPHGLLDGIM